MGNEQASRILAATSKGLTDLSNTMLEYSAKREELDMQRQAVELQRVGRMMDMLPKASPTAKKAIGQRLIPMVSKITGTQLPEDAFNSGLTEMMQAGRVYLTTDPQSEEELKAIGEYSDWANVVYGDDRKGAMQAVKSMQGMKSNIRKWFGGGTTPDEAMGEFEGLKQAKDEFGMKPVETPTIPGVPGGGGTQSKLSMVAPGVNPEEDREIISQVGQYIRDRLNQIAEFNRRAPTPEERAEVEQAGRDMADSMRRALTPGGGAEPTARTPGVPGAATSSGAVEKAPPGTYGLYGKPNPISPQQKEKISSALSMMDTLPSFTDDVLDMFSLRPDETGFTSGRATKAAMRDDFWGWLATLGKGVVTKTTLPSPIAKKINGQQDFIAKIFSQIAEGSGRLSDTDFRVGRGMVPDFLGDPGTAYAQFAATSQLMAAELRAQKEVAMAGGAPTPEIAMYDRAIEKMDGYVKGADKLIRAMSAPLRIKEEVIDGIVSDIYPVLSKLPETGAQTPDEFEKVILREAETNPKLKGARLILKTLFGMKDKTGMKPIRSQILNGLLKAEQTQKSVGAR